MGFKPTVYALRWPEGHRLHGLEVDARGLSMEETFKMASLGREVSGDGAVEERVKEAGKLVRGFVSRLVSWNLEEEDGTPVPTVYAVCTESGQPVDEDNCREHADRDHGCTFTGARAQDMPLMMTVIMDWIDAVSSVDTPLPEGSDDGPPQAPEASLPTESLSLSLQS